MSNSLDLSSPSSSSPNFSGTAFLLADQARAIMLTTLLDGRALPAGELAYASGITAQTASSHLGKLLAGGLISVESEGRHRYYRLAGAHVAQAMEQLAVIQPAAAIRRKALSPQERQLQFCRCCYDHLAGRLGCRHNAGLAGTSLHLRRARQAIRGHGGRHRLVCQHGSGCARHQTNPPRLRPAMPRLDRAAAPSRRAAWRAVHAAALRQGLATAFGLIARRAGDTEGVRRIQGSAWRRGGGIVGVLELEAPG
jgi:DNA-binding transcriptional ArsR family regulator